MDEAILDMLGVVAKKQHAPIHIPEKKEETYKAWKPEYKGQEPPF